MAVAVGLTGILGAAVGAEAFSSVLGPFMEYASGGALQAKIGLAIKEDWIVNETANYLDQLGPNTDNIPDAVLGTSPAGIVKMFQDTMVTTAKVGTVTDMSMAMTLYGTLFSFAFIRSIENSVAGAYSIIENVYRGGASVSDGDVHDLAYVYEYFDRLSLDLFMAEGGRSLPATLLSVVLGYQERIYRDMTELRLEMRTVENDRLTKVLTFASDLEAVVAAEMKAVMSAPIDAWKYVGKLLAKQAEQALARVLELQIEVTTAQTENGMGLVSNDELLATAQEDLAEAQSTQTSYQALVTSYYAAVPNAPFPSLSTLVSQWIQSLTPYMNELNKVVASLAQFNFNDIVSTLMGPYNDILAYRGNMDGTVGSIGQPITTPSTQGSGGSGTTPPTPPESPSRTLFSTLAGRKTTPVTAVQLFTVQASRTYSTATSTYLYSSLE